MRKHRIRAKIHVGKALGKVLLCTIFFLVFSNNALSENSLPISSLTKIELIEGDTIIQLSLNGTCRINNESGVTSSSYVTSVWQKLTINLNIMNLTQALIKQDLRELINKTGLVAIDDGGLITKLRITIDKETRKIDVSGLKMLLINYPKATHLSRFAEASNLIRKTTNHCITNKLLSNLHSNKN